MRFFPILIMSLFFIPQLQLLQLRWMKVSLYIAGVMNLFCCLRKLHLLFPIEAPPFIWKNYGTSLAQPYFNLYDFKYSCSLDSLSFSLLLATAAPVAVNESRFPLNRTPTSFVMNVLYSVINNAFNFVFFSYHCFNSGEWM